MSQCRIYQFQSTISKHHKIWFIYSTKLTKIDFLTQKIKKNLEIGREDSFECFQGADSMLLCGHRLISSHNGNLPLVLKYPLKGYSLFHIGVEFEK